MATEKTKNTIMKSGGAAQNLYSSSWQVYHCHYCYGQVLWIINLPTNVLITAEIVPCQTCSTIKEFLLYQWAWLNNIVTFRIISSWFILLVISHVDGAEWGLLSRVRRLILWVNTAQWVWKMHKSLSYTTEAGHIWGKCRVCKHSYKIIYNCPVINQKSESRHWIWSIIRFITIRSEHSAFQQWGLC